MKRGIIIMAKVPEAGKVKTRLQPFLTPEQSAELAECLLEDTIGKAGSVADHLIVAYSPAEQKAYFAGFQRINLLAQNGNTLGERIHNAFAAAFRQGLDSIVMIGTDSPSFPDHFIEDAFEKLETHDAVIGETEDGGFYLIALRKPDRRIFENVEWSSERTCAQTRNNLNRIGFSLYELSVWYDVDERSDLAKLKKDAFLEEFAPNTFDWLKTIF